MSQMSSAIPPWWKTGNNSFGSTGILGGGYGGRGVPTMGMGEKIGQPQGGGLNYFSGAGSPAPGGGLASINSGVPSSPITGGISPTAKAGSDMNSSVPNPSIMSLGQRQATQYDQSGNVVQPGQSGNPMQFGNGSAGGATSANNRPWWDSGSGIPSENWGLTTLGANVGPQTGGMDMVRNQIANQGNSYGGGAQGYGFGIGQFGNNAGPGQNNSPITQSPGVNQAGVSTNAPAMSVGQSGGMNNMVNGTQIGGYQNGMATPGGAASAIQPWWQQQGGTQIGGQRNINGTNYFTPGRV